MKRFLFTSISFLLITAFTMTTAFAYVIKGLEQEVDAIDITIDGKHYILLTDLCKAHGISLDWDSILRKVTLRKNGREVTFLIGSKYYYTGEDTEKLSGPVVMKDGYIYVPLRFAKYTAKRLFTLDKKMHERPIKKTTPIPKKRTEKEKRAERVKKERIAEKPPGREYRIKRVAIDPGHGGRDPGAIGRTGLREKDVVLDVAKRIKKGLQEEGIDAIMTRDSDRFVPLNARAKVANKNDADLFVSIHANANRAQWVKGFEIYFLSEATDDNARALAAAENSVLRYEESSFAKHTKVLDAIVWDLAFDENRKTSIQLAGLICKEVEKKLNLKRCRVKSARFYVLKAAETPAVLVELSYLSNRWEEKNLKDHYYKQDLAEAIVAGIINFKYAYDEANGFSR